MMRIPEHRRKDSRAGRWAWLFLAAALAVPPALGALSAPDLLAAGDEESDEAEEAGKEGERGREQLDDKRIFTNEDLKKYRLRARETARRGDTLVVDTTPEPPGEPPAAGLPPAEKARRKADLEARVKQSEERLLAIAARRRSLRNPFLPRPELSEQERIQSAGKSAVEQLKMLDSEEAEIRARLVRLREELAALARMPTRAAPEAGRAETGSPPPPAGANSTP